MLRSIRTFHRRSNSPGDDAIGALLQEIERREQLLARVRRYLPSELQAHCTQASWDAGTLVLAADSPVWASKLRLIAPDIRDVLHDTDSGIERCIVRVIPDWNQDDRTMTRASRYSARPRLSDATRAHLEQVAASFEDPALAEGFRRLARHY